MGRFPGFEESQVLQTGSPVAVSGSSDARIRGESQAALGQAMSKLGDVLASEKAEQASNKARELAAQVQIIAQQKAKKDGSDYQSIFQAEYSKGMAAIDKDLDPLSRQKFSTFRGRLDSEVQREGMETSFKMFVDHFKDVEEDNLNATVANVMNDPDSAARMFAERRIKYKQAIDAKIPQAVADTMFDRARKRIASGWAEGMLLKGRGDVSYLHRAKRLLGAMEDSHNIKIPPAELGAYGLRADNEMLLSFKYPQGGKVDPMMSEVLRSLSPEERVQLLNRVNQEFESHARVKLSYVDKVLKAAENKLSDLAFLNDQDRELARTAVSSVPPEVRPQYEERLRVINLTENAIKISVTQGLVRANDYIETEMRLPSDANLLQRDENRTRIAAIKENLLKFDEAKRQDPHRFLIAASDRVKAAKAAVMGDLKDLNAEVDPGAWDNYVAVVTAESNKFGIPVSLIDKKDAESINSILKSAALVGTDDALKKTIVGLEKRFGDDLGSVLADVTSLMGSEAEPQLPLIGVLPNGTTKARIVENIGNKQKIVGDFEKYTEAGSITLFKESMLSVQDKIAGSFYGGNPDAQNFPGIRSIVSAIDLEAKRLASRQVDRLDVDKAVKQATETILSEFKPVRAGRNNIMVPRNYTVAPIQRWIDLNLPQNTIQKKYEEVPSGTLFGPDARAGGMFTGTVDEATKPVPIDPGYIAEWDKRNTSWASESDEKFARYAKVVPTPDGLGIQLVAEMNGVIQPIGDKNGKPLFKSFKQLENFAMSGYKFYEPVQQPKPQPKAQPKAPAPVNNVQPTPVDDNEEYDPYNDPNEPDAVPNEKPADALKYFNQGSDQ